MVPQEFLHAVSVNCREKNKYVIIYYRKTALVSDNNRIVNITNASRSLIWISLVCILTLSAFETHKPRFRVCRLLNSIVSFLISTLHRNLLYPYDKLFLICSPFLLTRDRWPWYQWYGAHGLWVARDLSAVKTVGEKVEKKALKKGGEFSGIHRAS